MKKYVLLSNDTIQVKGITLYRIKAIRDVAFMKADILGGYVEGEYNLSHRGQCWVGFGAIVYGDARIYDNAYVGGKSCISGEALVGGSAIIRGRTHLCQNVTIGGNVILNGCMRLSGNCHLNGYLVIDDYWEI